MAAPREFREHLEELKRKGLLLRITKPVSPDLELAELTRAAYRDGAPALLFEDVEGANARVATNVYASEEKILSSLEAASFEELEKRVASAVWPALTSWVSDRLILTAQITWTASLAPRVVKDTSRGVNVLTEYDASLELIPQIINWPREPAPNLYGGLLIAEAEEGAVMEVCRFQVIDAKTASILVQPSSALSYVLEKALTRGEVVKASIAFSVAPPLQVTALLNLPPAVNKLTLAGVVAGKEIDVFKSEVTGLYLPASFEVLLEGHIDPADKRPIGPLGCDTGFYTAQTMGPIFALKRMLVREDPIVYVSVPSPPPSDSSWLLKAACTVAKPLLGPLARAIASLAVLDGGRVVAAAIKSWAKSAATRVGCLLVGSSLFPLAKLVVIVDEGVDVWEPRSLLLALAQCADLRRDLLVIRRETDEADASLEEGKPSHVAIIDATRKRATVAPLAEDEKRMTELRTKWIELRDLLGL